ncbi:uncharacterized protein MELLADRAFT_105776 [Melampsora larici-populina 98AG31]|uniref:Uncharacterized protein n=1 Tax=Melampsora larici-populina (strain 98AG31 / pathotype 3-4-7) TaxID=747676 RepID=F4RJA6_MELLP|nr:uncharacterized protein MELLADRAFT_105776 [Melampsora larici-populina 98AG31]EGG07533.1 hypothetical protein MELLADRAFT_105776 [Melampsora larici-populina 98AG31]
MPDAHEKSEQDKKCKIVQFDRFQAWDEHQLISLLHERSTVRIPLSHVRGLSRNNIFPNSVVMPESGVSSEQHAFENGIQPQQDDQNKGGSFSIGDNQLREGLLRLENALDFINQKMNAVCQKVEQHQQNERQIEELSTALRLADRKPHKLDRKVKDLETKIANMETEAYITASKTDGHDKVFRQIITTFGGIDLQAEYDSYESASQRADRSNERASSRILKRNRNLNQDIEAEIEKIVDDDAKETVDPPAGSRKRKKTGTQDEPQVEETPDQPDVQEIQVDYSVFEVEELAKMVSEVGVDTRGMDKSDLIRNCEKFKDLIITPKPPRVDRAEKNGSKSMASKRKGADLTFGERFQVICQAGPGKTTAEEPHSSPIETSTSVLPSLQHENSPKHQSRRKIPTSKAASAKKKTKAKERAREESEDDYEPELDSGTIHDPNHDPDNSTEISKSKKSKPRDSAKRKNQTTEDDLENSPNNQSHRKNPTSKAVSAKKSTKGKERAREESEDEDKPELDSGPIHDPNHDSDNSTEIFESKKTKPRDSAKKKNHTTEDNLGHSDVESISKEKSNEYNELKNFCLATSQRVDKLAQDVKNLTRVMENALAEDGEKVVKQKMRGGRTAAHVRFHIDVMLGRKSENSPPPPPASTEEKGRYRKEQWEEDRRKAADATNRRTTRLGRVGPFENISHLE